jgi:uncharacterized protein YbjT (DUF2867 family)
MKVVVGGGGSGLIGSKLVKRLRDRGHEVLAASSEGTLFHRLKHRGPKRFP